MGGEGEVCRSVGAEGEVAGAGGRRQAVGEGVTIDCRELAEKGETVLSEADEAVGSAEETFVVLSATEDEAVDGSRGEGEGVLREVADGEG